MTLMYDRSSEFWQMLFNVFRTADGGRALLSSTSQLNLSRF
jgi:hypothetical protein